MKQQKLKIEQVEMVIGAWNIRFKGANYKPEQLLLIAREYHEDLVDEGVTPAQFDAAVKMVRRRCRFFPVMAEILDAVREYRANPKGQVDGLLCDEDDGIEEFTYVNIVTKGCEGWLNLFFAEYPLALVRDVKLANQIRSVIPEKKST